MAQTIADIGTHLTFLGYSIEAKDPARPADKYMLLVNHATKTKFVALEFASNIILFQANLTTEKTLSPGMSDFVNTINRELFISRLFYDVVDDKIVLRFRAFYVGLYEKETFGQYWEMIQTDLQKLFALDSQNKIFTS